MVTSGRDERKLGVKGKGASSQGRLLGGGTGVGASCRGLPGCKSRKTCHAEKQARIPGHVPPPSQRPCQHRPDLASHSGLRWPPGGGLWVLCPAGGPSAPASAGPGGLSLGLEIAPVLSSHSPPMSAYSNCFSSRKFQFLVLSLCILVGTGPETSFALLVSPESVCSPAGLSVECRATTCQPP